MSETRLTNAEYRRFAWVMTVFLLLLLTPMPSLAQSTGTILGAVKDSSGALVPQAKVTILNTDTNDSRVVTTGDDGSFRFPALGTGHYSLKVEKGGFKTQTETGLTLEVSQDLVINPMLEVGASTQEVTVTGEAPLINTTNSSLGGLVNEDKMADLPLNGRNYSDLTFLQPGITLDANMGSSTSQGGTKGNFFSSNGAPIRSNMFMLDGAPVINPNGGNPASAGGTSLGVDGIKEFKVITGNYSAEYGLAMGSQILLVSKGGTDQFHGDAFDYLRNNALDARNFFDYGYLTGLPRLPHFVRNDFGASFGGPIKKDKVFFFGVYEGLRQNFGQTILDTVPGAGCHGASGKVITNTACPQLGSTTSVTVAPVIAGILGLYPLPNLGTTQYTTASQTPTSVNYGQMRVDDNISSTDTLFGRYTTDQAQTTGLTGASGTTSSGGTGFPQFSTANSSYDQFATISENHIFSPTVLNTARLSYSRYSTHSLNVIAGGSGTVTGPQYSLFAGEPLGPISLSGFSTFGGSAYGNYDQFNIDNLYTLSDDVYYTKGKHALRFGYMGIRWNTGFAAEGKPAGQLSFSSLANMLKGIPSVSQGTEYFIAADGNRNYAFYTHGFYAADDWRATSRLTFNLGLRYEFMTTLNELNGRQYALRNPLTDKTATAGPILAPPSKLTFSPRVGLAWDVSGNGKTSVRAAFGKYYDLGNVMSSLYVYTQSEPPLIQSGVHSSTGNNAVMTLPLTFAPSEEMGLQMPAYNDEASPAYMLRWNLTIERQLPGSVGLAVSYVGSKGMHFFVLHEGNPTIPSAVINQLPYWNGTETRVNPNFGAWSDLEADGSSTYHALQVALNKRMAHGLELQGAYTFAKSLDGSQSGSGNSDCSGALSMSTNNYDGSSVFAKGPSCFDIANNLRLNVLYHIPNIRSDNFAAKALRGWWLGSIYSFQTGYPFSPTVSTNRSQSNYYAQRAGSDYPNIATAADAAVCPAISSTCKVVPVPFDPNTVITGNPQQWFNPNMFVLPQMEKTPGGVLCTASPCYGTFGDVARGLLRGPGLSELDFSINKDTPMPWLGEQGKLEFRAEFFNILNQANFGMPSSTTYSGAVTDFGPYSEAPTASAGLIAATITTSRQIQVALKVIF